MSSSTQSSRASSFTTTQSLFSQYQIQPTNVYITQEFQDYGYRLAAELGDVAHKSLYIKLAKTLDRQLLETARSYVIDADSARSKPRLFMWKLKQLKEEQKVRESEKLEGANTRNKSTESELTTLDTIEKNHS